MIVKNKVRHYGYPSSLLLAFTFASLPTFSLVLSTP